MKKVFLLVTLLVMAFGFAAKAQTISPIPPCSNANALTARINAIENQGWAVFSIDYQPIFYFIQPDPPYLAGRVSVLFSNVCGPNEICLPLVRELSADAMVLNNNNTCVLKNWNDEIIAQ